ncbi:transporter substrate-binding domain-containing protein [Tissierella sp. Yu-01]|uniref:transporter substrate-binding domain-containing protein n=1 Tax=Tissierella sp. Yu-01 TaxID=3035694 RepID=UPI00240E3C10|nr:transporter substrate-binding domain-containing protein [Tissierella sp. Yu-01]WFA09154.1 transporter substrate-binding domain-containing protein [Tissierella sp. Yu-01]
MSKKIGILLLVVSMLFVFGACSKTEVPTGTPAETPADENSAEEGGKLAEIKKAGKIVLGTAADYPPFEFHKIIDGKDEIVGFDIEIAKLIADEIGVELEILDMKYEGLLPAIVTNDIDFIVAGMSANEERAQTVDFSQVYYEGSHTMIVRAEDKDLYKGPEDLAGKPVGAQKTTLQEEVVLNQFTESQYVGLSKITDLVLELQNKKVEAVVLAEPVAKAYVKQNPNLHLAEVDLGKEDGVSVAVNKGNEDLLEVINEVIEEIVNDGTIDRLINEATILAEEE